MAFISIRFLNIVRVNYTKQHNNQQTNIGGWMLRYVLLIVMLALSAGMGQQLHHFEESQKKQKLYEKWQQSPGKTANQDDFNVTFYDIRLDLNTSNGSLKGRVETHLFPTVSNLTRVDLNFAQNMQVDSVLVSDKKAGYTHSDHIISIQLNDASQQTDRVEVTVFYHGFPTATGLGSYVSTYFDSKPIVWTLSEPYGARAWWPCKDIPEDKADSVDIRVTVPEGMRVASNGLLVSETTENGRATFHWQERYPIATYLVSIAAYDYIRYSDEYVTLAGDTMPIQFFVFPDNYNNSIFRNNYALTNDMIEAFAGLFGEYPFVEEKYGHAEFLWGGGMEHQTCTSLGGYSEGLIAHELAPPWWGDMVTCADFHHIWLNEGFATYSEALWREHSEGTEAYHEEVSYNAYKGGGSIYVEDATNVGRIFHGGLSYAKASYVLHMLRNVVGDEDFFAILKAYYKDERFQYDVARTEDFREVCEQVSGLNLDKFFQQWIYGQYYPKYRYDWVSNERGDGSYEVRVSIEQVQTNTGLFWMPVDVAIYLPGETVMQVAWDSLRVQEFVFQVDQRPDSVALDPENWILKDVENGFYFASLDKGTLLVNGVNWAKHDSLIRPAYENKTFTDQRPFTFWDQFGQPQGDGYPDELPAPIGNGQNLPLDTLRQYSTILWLGNNADGDITTWKNTPVYDYLKAGGNVILIAPFGRNFLYDSLAAYTGIQWRERWFDSISGFHAEYPGLTDMPLVEEQTTISVFDTVFTDPQTQLLFSDVESFDVKRGIALWKKPVNGGRFNEKGGQFVYIAAAPFAMEKTALKENLTVIVDELLGGTSTRITLDGEVQTIPDEFVIKGIYPNPFNPRTTLEFSLPSAGRVNIALYDVLGRKVSDLARNTYYSAGVHALAVDGSQLSSGVYFIQVQNRGQMRTGKILLLR
jgi:hypothetical protein